MDLNTINASDKVFVKADKTRNMYKMECNDYKELLTENISLPRMKLSIRLMQNSTESLIS